MGYCSTRAENLAQAGQPGVGVGVQLILNHGQQVGLVQNRGCLRRRQRRAIQLRLHSNWKAVLRDT